MLPAPHLRRSDPTDHGPTDHVVGYLGEQTGRTLGISIEAAWMAEVRRRDEELVSGAVKAIPLEDALTSIRTRFGWSFGSILKPSPSLARR